MKTKHDTTFLEKKRNRVKRKSERWKRKKAKVEEMTEYNEYKQEGVT